MYSVFQLLFLITAGVCFAQNERGGGGSPGNDATEKFLRKRQAENESEAILNNISKELEQLFYIWINESINNEFERHAPKKTQKRSSPILAENILLKILSDGLKNEEQLLRNTQSDQPIRNDLNNPDHFDLHEPDDLLDRNVLIDINDIDRTIPKQTELQSESTKREDLNETLQEVLMQINHQIHLIVSDAFDIDEDSGGDENNGGDDTSNEDTTSGEDNVDRGGNNGGGDVTTRGGRNGGRSGNVGKNKNGGGSRLIGVSRTDENGKKAEEMRIKENIKRDLERFVEEYVSESLKKDGSFLEDLTVDKTRKKRESGHDEVVENNIRRDLESFLSAYLSEWMKHEEDFDEEQLDIPLDDSQEDNVDFGEDLQKLRSLLYHLPLSNGKTVMDSSEEEDIQRQLGDSPEVITQRVVSELEKVLSEWFSRNVQTSVRSKRSKFPEMDAVAEAPPEFLPLFLSKLFEYRPRSIGLEEPDRLKRSAESGMFQRVKRQTQVPQWLQQIAGGMDANMVVGTYQAMVLPMSTVTNMTGLFRPILQGIQGMIPGAGR